MRLLTEHTPSCLLYTYPDFLRKYYQAIIDGFPEARRAAQEEAEVDGE